MPNWAGELVPYIAQRWERGTIRTGERMKIIKHGNVDKFARAECPTCGCIFEFNLRNEVQYVQNVERDYMTGRTIVRPADAYVRCPECGEFFEITQNMLRREEGGIDGK